jgi:hypothetical protein
VDVQHALSDLGSARSGRGVAIFCVFRHLIQTRSLSPRRRIKRSLLRIQMWVRKHRCALLQVAECVASLLRTFPPPVAALISA